MDCIEKSKVPLRDYQKKVVKFINDKNNNSLLVVHGTGTGKTLSALVSSQCYLKSNPNGIIVVISPASLVGNFEKEMVKYGSVLTKNYLFFSFDKFISAIKKGTEICRNSMVIIDEVHNMRNMGTRYDAVYKCIVNCDKLLILTATPFVNNLLDMKAVIYLLHRDNMILRKSGKFISDIRPMNVEIGLKKKLEFFKDMFARHVSGDNSYNIVLDNIAYLLKGKVSFINDKTSEYFPKVLKYKVEIKMSNDFYRKYEKAINVDNNFGLSPEKFYHGYRRAVNSIGDDNYTSQKAKIIIDIVKQGGQTLIFSNWLEDGVYIITDLMSKNNVKYNTITGKTNSSSRMNIVEDYNKKIFNVLIITKAGSEGLDLKETKNIIIMDPVWNPSSLEQIIGRGVRFKSHQNLPIEKRIVNVYLLILLSPSSNIFSVKIPSGDELLYEILERKDKIKKDIENLLKNISI